MMSLEESTTEEPGDRGKLAYAFWYSIVPFFYIKHPDKVSWGNADRKKEEALKDKMQEIPPRIMHQTLLLIHPQVVYAFPLSICSLFF